MFRQHKDYRIRPFVSTRLPNKVSHVLSRQPQAPSSFWKLYCVYPMMTTKWLKERLLHKVIFSRETKVLIQTGCRERQTLWLYHLDVWRQQSYCFSVIAVLHSTLHFLDTYFHAHYSPKSDSLTPTPKLKFALTAGCF